ncbi:TPA: hypothetical protein ACL3F5_000626 [Streptococcus pneumoniae]|uniref:hypothetical protein n=1 Tax=Streptococcus pneumoniae TaxID=1313 RepID=UPI00077BFA88|nr:hypothetical protein [Streptococcus pneumoniae]KYQ24349.1 hypothetical protein AXX11_06290 [Streptococcus pneumoniae]KYQ26594.1 hypothetical protein AXX09_08920 [Streptococcus pneumoniae]HET0910608.1 hypothetical protein [Streptococcus pneumoniae]HEU7189844.1 hypothetical protein [Streptococcus pneumoniae]HEU7231392.1 hypothetical protein [Streptococcus pneumoniae]
MTRFEEILEECKNPQDTFFYPLVYKENTYEKTAISIFALLMLGVCCLFLFSQQSYKKLVQYYANDQNLPSRITYSEYSDK